MYFFNLKPERFLEENKLYVYISSYYGDGKEYNVKWHCFLTDFSMGDKIFA